MTRRFRSAAVAASAAALMLTALPATADSSIEMDDLEAAAANGVITVEGDFDFEHAGIELTDATGDALVPTADLASASVTMIKGNRTELSVTLADAAPEFGSTTVTMYRWETDAFIATAMHNRYSSPGDEWSFDLQECGQGAAGNECSSTDTFGSYADGVITWDLSGVVGYGDSFIPVEDGLHVTQTGAGAVWFNGQGFDTLDHGVIALPEMGVTATNLTTGESATDNPTRNSFDIELAGSAGDEIQITACFDGACASSTVTASE